ncbi:MAG: ComF family protein [Firmicutes bacterium]|nr:ComF family protein [Bacillota bacterium]
MNHKNIFKALARAADVFADMVYPADIYCIGCGKEIDPGELYSMCQDCLSEISWINNKFCAVCGKGLEDWYPEEICGNCLNNEQAYDRGLSCFQYNKLEREMLYKFKYHGKSFMARSFSEMMYDKIKALDWEGDIVIPVPMHKKKERQRGYNQADILAKFMAKRLKIPYNRDILIRTKNTAPMSRLSADERKKNLKGAFCVTAEGRRLISGKNVLLADDIYTMGVTAQYCSAVLKESGAESVTIMSMASSRNQRELPVIKDPA